MTPSWRQLSTRSSSKAFLAGSEDAFAHIQEGILVEANPAWAELFGHPDADALQGQPVMDFFDSGNQAALKGALVACEKGQWDSKPLRVAAIAKERVSPAARAVACHRGLRR